VTKALHNLAWVEADDEGDTWRIAGTTAVHSTNGMEVKSARPANKPQGGNCARKAMVARPAPIYKREDDRKWICY